MKLNEIFLLFRVQLLGFFGTNQGRKAKKDGGKRKQRGFAYMAAVSAFALLYFSFQYSLIIATMIETGGADPKTLPMFISFACCLIVLISSVTKASPTLFGSGDTDLLMALPVKNASIIASRVLVLYAMDFFYTVALLVPMAVMYVAKFKPPVAGIVFFAVLFFIIPLLPCVLGGVFGTLIEILTAKLGRSTLLRNLLSVVFIVLIMASSFAFNSGPPERMAETFERLSQKAASIYVPLQWIADAFCEADVLSFLLFAGVSLAVFALFCALVGLKFKALVGVVKARRSGRSYKLSAEKNGSPLKALCRKEFKRFFSSNVYFMNFGMGSIMALLATVAAVAFREDILSTLPSNSPLLLRALPFALCLCVGMSATASCSISLEGRSFVQLRALPIDARDLLRAKLAVNLAVAGAPALLCGTVLAVVFRMPALEACACVALPLLHTALTALLGLMANLRYPMMDWKTEITPVKQSSATFIAVVGFMPLSVVPAIAVMALAPYYYLVMPALLTAYALACLLCYGGLMRHAEEKIRAISV